MSILLLPGDAGYLQGLLGSLERLVGNAVHKRKQYMLINMALGRLISGFLLLH